MRALRCGHKPVRAKDTPGFIVNHAGRGYGTEALRILGEGIAEFHEVDRILRDCAGFRLGPFELFDLTGLDVSHPVMESIYRQYYEEPRYRPSPLTGQRVAAGLLGRKSGTGFYRYENGRQEEIPEPPAPAAKPTRVWISPIDLGVELSKCVANLDVEIDGDRRPGRESLCLVAPIVNIACDIAQQRIASPADIDLAVTLGLGYPQGPLAWGDAIGGGTILGILEGLHDFYQDPRYRPSPWLKRRAMLGVSLLSPEA